MTPAALAQTEAKRLYVDEGLSLRAIARRLRRSDDGVRQMLKAAGVELRGGGQHRGRPHPTTAALMAEIVSDVQAQFGGKATIADLREWLGEPEPRLKRALVLLCERGDLWTDGTVYRVRLAA